MAIVHYSEIKPKKLVCLDVELSVAYHFGVRQNIIVPNVSCGMVEHECDLLILTSSGYATEIEIKISRADLIKDKKKEHQHISAVIHSLYFAIPDYLENCIEHIPERAGVILVNSKSRFLVPECWITRPAKKNTFPKWDDSRRLELLRLQSMRIWGLKERALHEYVQKRMRGEVK